MSTTTVVPAEPARDDSAKQRDLDSLLLPEPTAAQRARANADATPSGGGAGGGSRNVLMAPVHALINIAAAIIAAIVALIRRFVEAVRPGVSQSLQAPAGAGERAGQMNLRGATDRETPQDTEGAQEPARPQLSDSAQMVDSLLAQRPMFPSTTPVFEAAAAKRMIDLRQGLLTAAEITRQAQTILSSHIKQVASELGTSTESVLAMVEDAHKRGDTSLGESGVASEALAQAFSAREKLEEARAKESAVRSALVTQAAGLLVNASSANGDVKGAVQRELAAVPFALQEELRLEINEMIKALRRSREVAANDPQTAAPDTATAETATPAASPIQAPTAEVVSITSAREAAPPQGAADAEATKAAQDKPADAGAAKGPTLRSRLSKFEAKGDDASSPFDGDNDGYDTDDDVAGEPPRTRERG